MDIIGVKMISGIVFFLLVVVFGCFPMWLLLRFSAPKCHERYTMLRNNNNNNNKNKNKKGRNNIAHCVHYFASGVLIATCLLHLLPESLEAVQEGLKSMSRSSVSFNRIENELLDAVNESTPVDFIREKESVENENESLEFYPLAELLVSLGFIFVYILDSTIKSIQERNKFRSKDKKSKDSLPGEQRYDFQAAREACDLGSARDENEAITNGMLSQNGSHFQTNQFHSNTSLFLNVKDSVRSTNILSRDHNHRLVDSCDLGIELKEASPHLEEVVYEEEEDEELHGTQSKTRESTPSTDVKSMALVMALCIHGFFDGVMLGLQTSVSVVYTLLFALSVHKMFVAVSMSLTLAKNYTDLSNNNCPNRHRTTVVSRYRYLFYVLLFGSVAPLGIIASAGFVHSSFASAANDEDVSLVPGCLQSFAVGTFLYVTFTETTGHHDGIHRTLCWETLGHASLLVGFALMAGLRVAFGET